MDWRCKFCGFEIKDREDRRTIQVKGGTVYVTGFCDNCLNRTIFKGIPIDQMRNYIGSTVKKED